MNKQVLISNLEVLVKEVKKAERHVGEEYANALSSSINTGITKEEFYLENVITMLLNAKESLELAYSVLSEETPSSLVKMAEESDENYKEISLAMKQTILLKKMEDNPMLGLISTLEALSKMSKK